MMMNRSISKISLVFVFFSLLFAGILSNTLRTAFSYDGQGDFGEVTAISEDVDFAASSTISGTVIFEGENLANESLRSVYIYSDTSSIPLQNIVVYNENKKFSFSVPAGTYYLEAKPQNGSKYLSEFYSGKTRQTADAITISADETITDINFVLDLGATVSGTIVNSNTSEPVPYAKVQILIPSVPTLNSPNGYTQATQADAEGKFELYGLPAGPAYINVLALNSFEDSISFTKDSSKNPNEFGIVEGAVAIELQKGQTELVTLELRPFAKVSGTITESIDGSPLLNAVVGGEDIWPFARTDADGQFEIQFDVNQIRSGDVELLVSGPCEQNQFSDQVCKFVSFNYPIIIDNGDELSGLNLTIDRKAVLIGKMTDEATATPINGRVTVQSIAEAEDIHNPNEYRCSNTLEVCGNEYVIYANPGAYRIYADFEKFPTENSEYEKYPTEFFENVYEASAASIVNLEANETRTIDFDLHSGDRIFGAVIDAATNEPLQNTSVSLHRLNHEGRIVYADTTSIDANGTYQFINLYAGTYFLFFDSGTDYIDQFYGGTLTRDGATPITLTKGTDSEINIALEQGSKVSVTLIDSKTGEPVEKPILSIYREDGQLYEYLSEGFSRDQGEVRYEGLAEGVYYLKIGAQNSIYGLPFNDYVTEFYGSTNSLEDATPITITKGSNFTDTLTVRRTQSISATLVTENFDPPAPNRSSVMVSLYQIDNLCDCEKLFATQHVPLSAESTRTHFQMYGINSSYDYIMIVNELGSRPLPITRSDVISFEDDSPASIEIELERNNYITGIVSASDSGEPLERVEVIFYKKTVFNGVEEYEVVSSDRTDSDGKYQSAELSNGTYYVAFETINILSSRYFNPEIESKYYVSKIYGEGYQIGGLDDTDPTPIELENSNFTLNMALDRGGIISGEVAFNSLYHRDFFSANAFVRTDTGLKLVGKSRQDVRSNTAFHIQGLPAGEYLVQFEETGYKLRCCGEMPLRYVWYGDVQHADESTLIILPTGGIVENISPGDIGSGGKIHLSIDQEQLPSINQLHDLANQGPTISLYDSEGNLVQEETQVVGNFPSFDGLWPGTYYVHFEDWHKNVSGYCNSANYSGEWNGGADSLEDSVPVTILGTEEHRVYGNLVIESLASPAPAEYPFSGRVVDESSEPIAGVTVTAESGRGASNTTITDANGEYSLNLIDGNYTITFEKEGYDFSGSDLAVTIDGSGQTVEQVVAPEEPDTTPTPEPPVGVDEFVYMPFVTR